MQPTTIYGIAAVPAILGLVQAATTAGLPKNLAPFAAIILGIGAGILSHSSGSLSWEHALAGGIALGLAASGLYSGSKHVGGAARVTHRRNQLRNLARRPPTDGRTDDPTTSQKVT